MSAYGPYRTFDAKDTAGMNALGWANPFAADGDKAFTQKIMAMWGKK